MHTEWSRVLFIVVWNLKPKQDMHMCPLQWWNIAEKDVQSNIRKKKCCSIVYGLFRMFDSNSRYVVSPKHAHSSTQAWGSWMWMTLSLFSLLAGWHPVLSVWGKGEGGVSYRGRRGEDEEVEGGGVCCDLAPLIPTGRQPKVSPSRSKSTRPGVCL